MVVLSGYQSPLYAQLYGDWMCVTQQAAAGSSHRHARQRIECLWLNAAAVQGLRQLPLFARVELAAAVVEDMDAGKRPSGKQREHGKQR